MTMPSGLLQWGQAGVYNAVDDRMVITALTNGRTGMARPVTLNAGNGLNVILRGGWLAIAAAGDGTSVVAGARDDVTFTVPAGGASARNDILWCDVSPDQATWTLALISQSQVAGRAGIQLGTISVPAGASLASQFGLQGNVSPYGGGDVRSAMNANNVPITGAQTSREIVCVICGRVGAATTYNMRYRLSGRVHERATQVIAGVYYRSGIQRVQATIHMAWATGGGTYVSHTNTSAGVAFSRMWSQEGTASMAYTVGPVPAWTDFFIDVEGQIRLNPVTPTDVLGNPQQEGGLAVVVNAQAGANITIREGCYMELIVPGRSYAWAPQGVTHPGSVT